MQVDSIHAIGTQPVVAVFFVFSGHLLKPIANSLARSVDKNLLASFIVLEFNQAHIWEFLFMSI